MTHTSFHEDDSPGRLDPRLWRRMLVYARPYRRPALALAFSGIGMAAADAALPLVTGWVIDDAIRGARTALAVHAALYAGVVAVMAAIVWFFIYLAGRIATGFACDVRRAAFAQNVFGMHALRANALGNPLHVQVGFRLADLPVERLNVADVLAVRCWIENVQQDEAAAKNTRQMHRVR